MSAAPTAPARGAWLRTPVDLLRDPGDTLTRLYASRGALSLLGFPALSGIFVAYTIARGLALGDRLGFAAAATGVLAGGALLGIIALWFAGTLPMWTDPESASEEDETTRGHMFVLFSHATSPFLPLLLIIVPVDLYFHGSAVFSAAAAPLPAAVAWSLRALILLTIVLWAALMVRGTAAERHESNREAALDLLRWGAEFVAIAVLFAIALGLSLMFW